MKKTIIASAIAAAVSAPAAFADVKISGMVNPEYAIQNDDSVDFTPNTDLVISGSETLDNGMKVSFKYHQFADGAESASGIDGANEGHTSTTVGNNGSINSATYDKGNADGANGGKIADLSVTLSGDFGSISAGRLESFHEAVAQGFTNIDASHDADLENNLTSHSIGDRVNGVIAYTSPSFNGLTVSAASVSLNDADDNGSDATDIMVKYSNNGLMVFAEQFDIDGGAQATAFGASYKMGDIEVRAMQRTHETDVGVEKDATFLGAKYNMGNITLAAGKLNEDTANKDASILSVEYSLSKRTSVYAVDMNSDDTAEDQTVFGIKHTF
jgi:predicted porin